MKTRNLTRYEPNVIVTKTVGGNTSTGSKDWYQCIRLQVLTHNPAAILKLSESEL